MNPEEKNMDSKVRSSESPILDFASYRIVDNLNPLSSE